MNGNGIYVIWIPAFAGMTQVTIGAVSYFGRGERRPYISQSILFLLCVFVPLRLCVKYFQSPPAAALMAELALGAPGVRIGRHR